MNREASSGINLKQSGNQIKSLTRALVLWLGLSCLWFLFVFQTTWPEAAVGAAGSALTFLALRFSLRAVPLHFRPKGTWLGQALRLPQMIAFDSWLLIKDLARRMRGGHSRAGYELVRFAVCGGDSYSAARRALVLLFVSTSPNSIVLDVDRERGTLLLHYLVPARVPEIIRKLQE